MSLDSNYVQLDDQQMKRFTDLIYDVAGIRIQEEKRTMLSNRIHRRLKATGLDCYDDYFHKLRKLSLTDSEWDRFLQDVSTHETYMYRDQAHWTWFQEDYLPDVVQQAREGKRPKSLRIWSAACSTGDEAHTIAVCLASKIPDFKSWKIEIIGTDIGVDAVATARKGCFSKRSVNQVPEDWKKRFFREVEPGVRWQAVPEIRNLLEFRQHNLLAPLREAEFDVVFLKNVLIYFDDDSKSRALKNILPKIANQGILVTTGAEGIGKMLSSLERLQCWLYRKNEG